MSTTSKSKWTTNCKINLEQWYKAQNHLKNVFNRCKVFLRVADYKSQIIRVLRKRNSSSSPRTLCRLNKSQISQSNELPNTPQGNLVCILKDQPNWKEEIFQCRVLSLSNCYKNSSRDRFLIKIRIHLATKIILTDQVFNKFSRLTEQHTAFSTRETCATPTDLTTLCTSQMCQPYKITTTK